MRQLLKLSPTLGFDRAFERHPVPDGFAFVFVAEGQFLTVDCKGEEFGEKLVERLAVYGEFGNMPRQGQFVAVDLPLALQGCRDLAIAPLFKIQLKEFVEMGCEDFSIV